MSYFVCDGLGFHVIRFPCFDFFYPCVSCMAPWGWFYEKPKHVGVPIFLVFTLLTINVLTPILCESQVHMLVKWMWKMHLVGPYHTSTLRCTVHRMWNLHIFLLFYMGIKLGLSHRGRNTNWGFTIIGCLNLARWQGTEGSSINRTFMICIPHLILLLWCQGGGGGGEEKRRGARFW